MNTGPQTKKTISIKYLGNQNEIDKIKMKVGWTKLDRTCELLTHSGKRILYPELYKESDEKCEEKRFFVIL
jgi:hypothetical protein